MEFKDLSTDQFRIRMRPHALKIYQQIFGNNIKLVDLKTDNGQAHILDKEFAIDSLLTYPSREWISLQEKYRKNDALRYMEFTQEIKNGDGTNYESDGEWYHLGAQLYFYGWATQDESAFEKWFILDIVKYKLLVRSFGGIRFMGQFKRNQKHGKASFIGIPVDELLPAMLYHNFDEKDLNNGSTNQTPNGYSNITYAQ